jgi:uracil-DNA glycosylase
MKDIVIQDEWKEALKGYFESDSFKKLRAFVREEYHTTKVFPEPKNLFKAFDLTPFSQVKVVLLGQDPYHGDGQATGLSFSVPQGTPLPPSLKNIYKEIEDDMCIEKEYTSGDLTSWAVQGVLLLNAILSVRAHMPASHQKKGWEEFTDEVLKTLSDKKEGVVFILWGSFARSKKHLIDTKKHLVLESAHPSPFSAYGGFFGCKHFSKCNEYLKQQGKGEISW